MALQTEIGFENTTVNCWYLAIEIDEPTISTHVINGKNSYIASRLIGSPPINL